MPKEWLYKWMIEDFTSPIQNTEWPVEAGEWTPEVAPILCKSGYHGWHEKDALQWLPETTRACTLWTVETRGQVIEGDDKFVAASMRLVYKVGTTNERNLRLFAADCAEDVLPLFLAIRSHDDRPAKAIEAARLFAEGQIDIVAWDPAWAAAGAAWAAAGVGLWAAGAAAWAAAGAARAAAGAAWAAAGAAGAAAGAAWAAAGAGWVAAGAARAAAGDAARAKYSNWLVVRVESDF